MKKISFYILILFSTVIFAQDNSIKIENVVNEQFGTLLESLLTDGKIDEANAKNYLEAVFGYDDDVNNYLNTNSFTQQFNSFKQIGTSKLSTDTFMAQLNSSLLSFIPAEKQQVFMQHMQAQMMIQGSMNELVSGKIGSNSVELASGIIQGIGEAKAERQKKEVIAQKLAIITPTLDKLKNNKDYKKLKVVDDFSKYDNWILNSNPAVLREDNQNRYTINTSRIEGGVLKIATENYVPAVFNWDKETKFELSRFYKNIEKFDFSKDFTMNLYLSIGEKSSLVNIVIGKGYYLNLRPDLNGFTNISSPIKYFTTDMYGSLNYSGIGADGFYRVDEKAVDKISYNNKESKIGVGESKYYGKYIGFKNKNNTNIDFRTSVVKITISKVDNVFTCKLNDSEDLQFSNEISYFPDKYFLGFLVNGEPLKEKKGLLNIHKLELEHL
ncbi:hypothetical protein [Flavobacterium sp. UBA6195]|uniref:hypothetical protein n=1 Tax=Flavobacterium sp. UBA6195 TaxID=1946554 RepID=UPI0025B929A3|nr:hypothetical protein [Flavobacterium sp. UBA6195]